MNYVFLVNTEGSIVPQCSLVDCIYQITTQQLPINKGTVRLYLYGKTYQDVYSVPVLEWDIRACEGIPTLFVNNVSIPCHQVDADSIPYLVKELGLQVNGDELVIPVAGEFYRETIR